MSRPRRVLQHAASFQGSQKRPASRIVPPHHLKPLSAFRFGASEAPPTAPQHPRAHQHHARTMLPGTGRCRQKWRLVHRFPSALRLARCHPRLQLDQDLAPFFVEDRSARSISARPPHLRSKVNVPLAAGEEWGKPLGLQQTRRRSLHRLRARYATPTSAGITEMMKIAASVKPTCRHRFPTYRAHRHGCIGQQRGDLLRACPHGIQLPGPHLDTCPSAWTSKMASLSQRSPRSRRGAGFEVLTQIA